MIQDTFKTSKPYLIQCSFLIDILLAKIDLITGGFNV